MSEKVLGFIEEEALFDDMAIERHKTFLISKSKLVPVRLKSKSVSLKWLKKWCTRHELRRFEYDSEYVVVREDLLSAAKKETSK